MSEWLRSMTRNHMGSARTGSNPVGDDQFVMTKIRCQIFLSYCNTNNDLVPDTNMYCSTNDEILDPENNDDHKNKF